MENFNKSYQASDNMELATSYNKKESDIKIETKSYLKLGAITILMSFLIYLTVSKFDPIHEFKMDSKIDLLEINSDIYKKSCEGKFHDAMHCCRVIYHCPSDESSSSNSLCVAGKSNANGFDNSCSHKRDEKSELEAWMTTATISNYTIDIDFTEFGGQSQEGTCDDSIGTCGGIIWSNGEEWYKKCDVLDDYFSFDDWMDDDATYSPTFSPTSNPSSSPTLIPTTASPSSTGVLINSWECTSAPDEDWVALATNGVGSYLAAAAYGGGIYLSYNSGSSWFQTSAPDDTWSSLGMSYQGKYVLAAASSLYTSYDYGQKWTITSISVSTSGLWKGLSVSDEGQYMMACAAKVLYVSSNYGSNWTLAKDSNIDWTSCTMSSTGENMVAIGTSNGNGVSYYSSDYGVTWLSGGSISFSTSGSVVSSFTGKFVYVSSDGFYISSDYGATFQSSTTPYLWVDSPVLQVTPSGQFIAASSSNGYVFLSVNYGFSWSRETITSTESVYGISMDGSGAQVQVIVGTTATSSLGVSYITGGCIMSNMYVPTSFPTSIPSYKPTNEPSSTGVIVTTWIETSASCLYAWTSISSSSSGQYIVASTYDKGIFVSHDYGETWKNSNAYTNQTWSTISNSYSGKYVIAGSNTLYISSNYGIDFTATSLDISTSGLWTSFAVSETGQFMLACYSSNSFYVSDTFGATWSTTEISDLKAILSCSLSGSGSYMSITGITDKSKSGTYNSADFGVTWVASSVSFSLSTSVAYTSMSLNGEYRAISSNAFLYLSSDYGVTYTKEFLPSEWTSTPQIVSDSSGQFLTATSSDGYIFLSSTYGAFWEAYTITDQDSFLGVAVDSTGSRVFTISGKSSTASNGISSAIGCIYSNNYSPTSLPSSAPSNEPTNKPSSLAINSVLTKSEMCDEKITAIATCGSGQYIVAAAYGIGIYVSDNYGLSYNLSNAPNSVWSVIDISVDCSYVIAGADYLYASSNYGQDWTQTSISAPSSGWTGLSVSNTGKYIIACAEEDTFYVSSSYGATWTQHTGYDAIWKSSMVCLSGAHMVLIGLYYDSNGAHGISYYSVDFGVTWNIGGDITSGSTMSGDSSSNGQHVQVSSGGELYVSSNYGANFTKQSVPSEWEGTPQIVSDSSGQFLAAASSSGNLLTSSTFGTFWTATKVSNSKLHGVTMDQSGQNVATLVGATTTVDGVTYSEGCVYSNAYSPTSAPVSFSPSFEPSHSPTKNPTYNPSKNPINIPTSYPTHIPSLEPSNLPSDFPTFKPSYQPSNIPSKNPTYMPTNKPTHIPTLEPTDMPSLFPTLKPSHEPTNVPSEEPSSTPTFLPSKRPTKGPTTEPSFDPTNFPSFRPTKGPTTEPTSIPSNFPTLEPSFNPTNEPTTFPTNRPSFKPSKSPTGDPSSYPTELPSLKPTNIPSRRPTSEPTNVPTQKPTFKPTNEPTLFPTQKPTFSPTQEPSNEPTGEPTNVPTQIPSSTGIITYDLTEVNVGCYEWSYIASCGTGSHVIATSTGGGIYMSSDYGHSWNETNAPTGLWYVVDISLNCEYIIAGGTNLYFSTNYGADWTKTSIKISNAIIKSLSVSNDGQYIIVSLNEDIFYVSNNYGSSFTSHEGYDAVWSSTVISSSGQYILLTGNSKGEGVSYYSTDYGVSWTLGGEINYGSTMSSDSSSDGQYVQVSSGHGLFISNNYGVSFVNQTIPSGWEGTPQIASDASGQFLSAASESGRLFYSTNYGASWTYKVVSTDNALFGIAMDSSGASVFTVVGDVSQTSKGVSYADGCIYSNNYVPSSSPTQEPTYSPTSTPSSTGIIKTSLVKLTAPISSWSDLTSCGSGAFVVATVDGGGIWISNDYGNTWNETSAPYGNWSVVDISMNCEYLVAGADYLYISSNYGVDWTQTSIALPSTESWSGLSLSNDGKYIISCAASDTFYVSTDYGSTWVAHTGYDAIWKSSMVCLSGRHMVIIGLYTDSSGKHGVSYYSVDYGVTWNLVDQISSGTTMSGDSSSSGQYVQVSSGGHFYVSSNYGANYTKQVTPPEWEGTPQIVSDSSGQFVAAASTSGYLLYSSTYGQSWTSHLVTSNRTSLHGITMDSTGGSVMTIVGSVSKSSTGCTSAYGEIYSNNFAPTSAPTAVPSMSPTNRPSSTGVLVTEMQETSAPYTSWSAIASCGTGGYAVAAESGGGIYISKDYGHTWNQTNAPDKSWSVIEISNDCKYLLAGADYLYISTNYGDEWTVSSIAAPSSGTWTGLSVSDNGRYAIACATSDSFYVSQSYGATWTEFSGYDAFWTSSMSCLEGTHMAIVGNVIDSDGNGHGATYRSLDYGVTWKQGGNVNNSTLSSSTMSANGQYLAISSNGLHLSSDYGRTFHAMPTPANWSTSTFISSDVSGQFVAAASSEGTMHYSSDYGQTFDSHPLTSSQTLLGIAMDSTVVWL